MNDDKRIQNLLRNIHYNKWIHLVDKNRYVNTNPDVKRKKVDPEKHIITHGIYNNRYIPLTFKGSYKEFFKLMNLDKNSIIKIKNTYVNKKSVQNDGKKKIINTSAKKANIQPKKKDEDANKTLILKIKAESDAKIKLAIKKNEEEYNKKIEKEKKHMEMQIKKTMEMQINKTMQKKIEETSKKIKADADAIIKANNKHNFVFVISSYNNEKWYKRNLDSIVNQVYNQWRIVYVDDNSTDNTNTLLHKYIEDNNISHKIKVIKNNKNYRQGYSRYIAFKDCGDDEICCLLDGDDWLYNNHVLTKLNDLYNKNDILVSYGSYIRYENGKVSNYILGKDTFPDNVIENNSYQIFSKWISVHLRTGYARLFKSYPYEYLLDFNNELISAATDQNEMFWVLNKSNGKHMNAKFNTVIYNKDASLEHPNSYYHMDFYKNTKLYRTEISYYLRLNKLNRYEKQKTILIFTDLNVNDLKLQEFCQLINFKYKLIFKNELVEGVNDIKIEINHILFFDYSDINIDLIEKLKEYTSSIMSNIKFENVDIFNNDDIFIKLNYENLNMIKKNYDEFNELYRHSIVINHTNKSCINEYVDKVYCINLVNENEKLDTFIEMITKHGINCEIIRVNKLKDSKLFMFFFNKLSNYKSPGELGCLLSHLMCCIDAKKNNYKNIIILEEDCIPIKNINKVFSDCKNVILSKPYVYLGASQWNWSNHLEFHKKYYNAWRTCGSFAIYLNKEMIPLLIEEYKKMNKSIDNVMFDYYNTPPKYHNQNKEYYGLNKQSSFYGKCIVMYPNLFIADVTTSNIRSTQNMKERAIKMKWNLNLYDI